MWIQSSASPFYGLQNQLAELVRTLGHVCKYHNPLISRDTFRDIHRRKREITVERFEASLFSFGGLTPWASSTREALCLVKALEVLPLMADEEFWAEVRAFGRAWQDKEVPPEGYSEMIKRLRPVWIALEQLLTLARY